MGLDGRLGRLERALHAGPPAEGTDYPLTTEQRVAALRALTARVLAQEGAAAQPPSPDLGGEEYLAAWWPWFLGAGGGWPEWAQDSGVRLAAPPGFIEAARGWRGAPVTHEKRATVGE